MALWYGLSFVNTETGSITDQQIHGSFTDTNALERSIESQVLEEGHEDIPVVIRFELVTDDIPELVSGEEMSY